jgi:hypothetical protein
MFSAINVFMDSNVFQSTLKKKGTHHVAYSLIGCRVNHRIAHVLSDLNVLRQEKQKYVIMFDYNNLFTFFFSVSVNKYTTY